MPGKQAKAHRAKRIAPRVRIGGKHRRDERRVRPKPVSKAKLLHIVRGGEVKQAIAPGPERARAPVNAVRSPFFRRDRAVRKDHRMTETSRCMAKFAKSLPTRRTGQVIVAIDKPALSWQAGQRSLKRVIIPLVGDQPDQGKS